MGDAEIVRIERGAWHCFVEFRSRQNARELEASIEQWRQDFKAERSSKHEEEFAAIYKKRQEEMEKNPPYVPATQILSNGKKVEGHIFIDDTGKSHYIFPDDPPNNAVMPINTD